MVLWQNGKIEWREGGGGEVWRLRRQFGIANSRAVDAPLVTLMPFLFFTKVDKSLFWYLVACCVLFICCGLSRKYRQISCFHYCFELHDFKVTPIRSLLYFCISCTNQQIYFGMKMIRLEMRSLKILTIESSSYKLAVKC